MKRFHVHVAVPDLQQSIRFYSTLFGMQPSVVKEDYAKWMLEDPRVNFAISHRGSAEGVNHLGFQVDDAAELEQIHARLDQAESAVTEEKGVACCYARSDKYWVTDPAGIAWESFQTLGSVPFFGEEKKAAAAGSCCAPKATATEKAAASCCGTSAKDSAKSCC
jgi:catechol 2,3-dioxygenase-like lactoylglutathione lyase family enzyme